MKTVDASMRCMALVAAVLLAMGSARAQAVVERLSVPGPMQFGNETFALAWSSNPAPSLYKQEYLPAGEVLEQYRSMFMVDMTLDGVAPAQKALQMVELLKVRKASDPLVNYEIIVNEAGDMIVLDFARSAPGADGRLIVEWNAYRYEPYAGGSVLTAISRRAYGEEVDDFLRNRLRPLRTADISTLTAMPPLRPKII